MKTVLIDHSTLGRFCGFTEISENFGRILAQMDVPDIHFVYMVPEKFIGCFGNRVSYVSSENIRRDLKALPVRIDLWHSTHQLFKYRRFDSHTLQLLTIHDLNFLLEKKGIHRLRHIIQLHLRVLRSDHITVISEYVEKRFRRFTHLKASRVDFIYNGVRPLETEARIRPAFVRAERPFFFALGQVRKRKNFQSLVPMMKAFPDTDLYICGDDSARYASRLRKLISEEGSGNVFLAGPVSQEEKNWLYASCAAFFMPSKLEGFGLPVLEAMRFGKPVFSSTLTSLPEIGGTHAFYWKDFESESMASVVKSGLSSFGSDPAIAIDEIEYSKGFDYHQYTLKYLALYRRLLSNQR